MPRTSICGQVMGPKASTSAARLRTLSASPSAPPSYFDGPDLIAGDDADDADDDEIVE